MLCISKHVCIFTSGYTIIHTQRYMKLSKKALKGIKNQPSRLKLALALGFSEQWINRLIRANKSNGPLITVKSMQVIREETGLTDSEILQEEIEPVKA